MKRTYTIHHLSDSKFNRPTDPSISWPKDYILDVANITIEVEGYIKDPAYYLFDIFGLAQSKNGYWAEKPEISNVKPKLTGEYIGSCDNRWRSLSVGDVISDNEGNIHRITSCGFSPLILKGKLVCSSSPRRAYV